MASDIQNLKLQKCQQLKVLSWVTNMLNNFVITDEKKEMYNE